MAPASKASVEALQRIGKQLKKTVLDNPTPSPESCKDFIDALQKEGSVSIVVLEQSKIGNSLAKAIKSFKRHKRTDGEAWMPLIEQSEKILARWKQSVADENASRNKAKKVKAASMATAAAKATGLPKTVTEYKTRLMKHNKEMYKNPPVLPPSKVSIEETNVGFPKRDKKTGQLKFEPGDDSSRYTKLGDFRPNRTPEEVLRAGSFGGTYFRPIVSGVTNISYNPKDVLDDSVEPSWIEGLDAATMLTSATYRQHVNKFGVKCGGSLGMWESSGWIADCDPYGWFQWYCRFYRGRRCADDERQISRWLKSAGPKGRFRSQICNKILLPPYQK